MITVDHAVPAHTAGARRHSTRTRRPITATSPRSMIATIGAAALVASVSVVVGGQVESRLRSDAPAVEAEVDLGTATLRSGSMDLVFAEGAATVTPAQGAPVSLITRRVGDLEVAPGAVVNDGGRIEHDLGAVVEWYRVEGDAFEHGYTIESPVSGDTLTVDVEIVGGTPHSTGSDVVIARAESTLSYRKLVVIDADGDALPAEMGVDGQHITLTVDTTGATYPIEIDPILSEDEKLQPSLDPLQPVHPLDDSPPFGPGGGLAVPAVTCGANAVIGLTVYTAPNNPPTTYPWIRAVQPRCAEVDVLAGSFSLNLADAYDGGVLGGNVGDPGVNSTPLFCSPGSVVTEIRGNTGSWVDSVQLRCAALQASGALGPSTPTIAVGHNLEFEPVDWQGCEAGGWATGLYGRAAQEVDQIGFLCAGPSLIGDGFGQSIDVDGNRLVVGAPGDSRFDTKTGAVYVYERPFSGAPWTLDAVLTLAGAPTSYTPALSYGVAVAVDGDRIAVGDPDTFEQGEPGRVWLYTRVGPGKSGETSWGTPTWIDSPNASADGFGWSLDFVDNGSIVIGAPFHDNGAVYVWNGETMTQLPVPDEALGDEIGYSVAVSPIVGGHRLIVGAPGTDDTPGSGVDGGAVVLYTDTGAGFGFERKFSDFVGLPARRIGTAVDVSGDRIVYGGFGDGLAGTTQEVWVQERNSAGNWPGQNLLNNPLAFTGGATPNDWVSISGGTVAVGVPGAGGEVRLYRTNGTTWSLDDSVRASDREVGDRSGEAVELDGRNLVFGAPGGDFDGNSFQEAGAAYSKQVPVVATAIVTGGWFTPSNWDIGVVPSANDVAIIANGVSTTVNDNVTIRQVTVDGVLNVDAPLELTGDATQASRVNGTLAVLSSRLDMGARLVVDGTLDLAPGAELFADGAALAGSGSIDHRGAIVKMTPGPLTTSSGLTWLSSPSSSFLVLDGDVTHNSNAFPVAGELRVATGSQVTLNSGLELEPTAVVDVGIAGPASDPTNYGRIVVGDGTNTIAGTLRATYVGEPSISGPYPVITCASCFDGPGLIAHDVAPLHVVVDFTTISLQEIPNKIVSTVAGQTGFGSGVDIDGGWAAVRERFAVYILRQTAAGPDSWVVEQVITGLGSGDDVAIEGNHLAVGSASPGEADVYVRSSPGNAFSFLGSVPGGGDVAIGDGRLLVGDPYPIDTGPSARVYRLATEDTLLEQTLVPPPEAPSAGFGTAVDIDGDLAVVGAEFAMGGQGRAYLYGTDVEGVFLSLPTDTLSSPEALVGYFGNSVAISNGHVVVGEWFNDGDGGDEGAAWAYELSGGSAIAPQRLVGADTEPSDTFGSSVDIDGDTVVVGAGAAQKFGYPMRDGAAYVFQRDSGGWVETAQLRARDGLNQERFGDAVAISGGNVLVGARQDLNDNGPTAGAVYAYDAPAPLTEATLSLDISVSDPTPTVGVSTISVADLPPAAFQGYGGTAADYAGSDLQTIDLRADLGNPNADTTPIADVTLGQLALDTTPVTRRLLDTILLPEISVTGGWSARLEPNGPPLVEQSLTLLAVLDDPTYGPIARAIPLKDLDLGPSNLGSISTYAALLAGVPVTELPDPSGNNDPFLYWCAEVAAIGLDCSDDFGVSSPPAAALTLPVLSFAGVDIDSSDLLGVALDGGGAPVDLSGTAIGELPVEDLSLELVPLASQPLVPSKSLPSFLADSLTVPEQFRGVTLGELGGAAPLSALDPANVLINGSFIGDQPLSVLDLAHRPNSPIQDYSWAPPALGAGLLLSNEGATPPNVGSVPLKDIGLNLPVLAAPLDDIELPSGRRLGDVRLGELLAQSAPFGASPFGASPFGASPFGASPFGASPFGASPFGASPFGASPFGASPFGASPFGASPFGASPFGASPFGASPFGASPFGASPFGASPFGASPISELGLAVPITALPLGEPIGTLPTLGSLRLADLDSSNLLFDLPIQSFLGSTLLECELIDCRAPGSFTIGDALAAGAMSPNLALSDVQPGLYGLTALDLVGAHPALTETSLTAYVAAQTITIAAVELAPSLSATGIPIQLLSIYPTVTLTEARLLFSGWRLIDLAGLAVGLEPDDLEAGVDGMSSTLTVADLTGKLPVNDPAGLGPTELWVDTLTIATVAGAAVNPLTVADAWPFFRSMRLEHVKGANSGPQATLDGPASGTTLGPILDNSPPTPALQPLDGLLWGDIVGSAGTEPLASVAGLTVADIVSSFGSVTLGEFLRAAQPIAEQQTEQIDLSSVDLAAYSEGTPVELRIDVQVNDATRADSARVVATLPDGSRYVEGSAELEIGTPPASSVTMAPTQFGDTLIWQLANLQPGTPYRLVFDVRSPAKTGIVTAGATGQLLSNGAIALASTSIEYVEVFEPNDLPDDSGVVSLTEDQIVLSQIGDATDVDLFRFTVTTPGTRIGADLWDLPADYDLTIIGPIANQLAEPAGRVLESVGDSQLPINGGVAADTIADGGNYQPPPGFAVIARSTRRGSADEVIEPVPVTTTGDYYLVVSGYDGAFDNDAYALRVNADLPAVAPPVCPAGGTTFPFAGVDAPPQTLPDGVNTLFVINHERFGNQYGTAQADAVLNRINALRADLVDPSAPNGLGQLGLVAGVVDLGRVGLIDTALAAWDARPCEVDRANAVVSETISHLAGIYAANPGIEYVVMVGSDKIIPFARLADKTLLGNEQNYASTFGGDLGSPLYAALAAGTFFSDDPFVDPTPNLVSDRALFVAERSIGRLVEDPESILGQLDGFASRGGAVRTDSGLVTGYDFLADSSEAIGDRLSNDAADGFTGPILTPLRELISEDWTAADLAAQLIPPTAPTPGIGAVNGHYSHQGMQSALGSANDDSTDALFVDDFVASDFDGALLMTVGCHSGLSVDETVAGALGVDLAEVFSERGAAAYVAQSGYGYGSTESIQLTERLLVDFAARLDGNFTVGEALKLAKNKYVSGLSAISVYDEKSLQQAILYGLPFSTPDVANPPAPAPAPPTVDLDPVPGVDGLQTSSFSAQIDAERREIPGRGVVYEVDGNSYAPQAKPLQPIATFDTTGPDVDNDGVPDARLHGALLRGASAYIADPLMDPVYHTPTIDNSANEPELQPADSNYPMSPLGTSAALTEHGQRDTTVVMPGRFQATEPDGRGRQAIYDDLAVQTLHSLSDDWTAPTIGTVRQSVSGGVVTVSVTTPSADVAGVVVAIVQDLPSSSELQRAVWRSFDLARPASGGDWSGGIALLGNCAAEIEYLVQMYDESGNVAVSSNKAAGFTSTCLDDPPPPPDPDLTVTPLDTNLDSSGWYTGPVTVDVTTNVSGPITYRIGGGSLQTLTGTSFQIVGSGVVSYSVQAGASTFNGTVRIDAGGVPPVVTSTVKDVPAGKNFSVNFSCTDISLISCDGVLAGPSHDGPVFAGQQFLGVAGQHTLTVTSDDAISSTGPTTEVFTFDVIAQAPEITLITGPTQPELIGTTSTISIEFTDPELELDDYTVEFDFGKSLTGVAVTPVCVATSGAPGSTVDATCSLTEPTATAPGTATASIVYPRSGVYTVGVTVTDASGLEATAEHAFVVIFDPDGGSVSGAGQFVSDESSYFGNGPAVNARTTFGFNARYDDGDDDGNDDDDDDEAEHDDGVVPEGKTKLHVKDAFKFKSTAYEYLVVNDTYAVAEGVGKVNGVAGYRMRVQAIDNGSVDFFQITIWDPDTGAVVYDNGVLYNSEGNVDGDRITKGNIKVRP